MSARAGVRRVLAVLVAAALLATAADAKPKKKPSKPAADADESEPSQPAKGKSERPFASAGFLEAPVGRDVRMGDPSGGLAIVAQGGSLIKRVSKALALESGRMGVSMKGGKAAIRVVAGSLAAETASGKFTLERTTARIRLSVLEGKVYVAGVGAPRNMTAGQKIELTGGKVTTGTVAADVRDAGLEWIAGR